MTDTVKVAIFGNGFARQVILPALRQVEGVRLAGIAGPRLERVRATAAEFGIETAGSDHREILDRTHPDLVFVVTPPHRHAEMAIDALEAGCHVVCEKPTALNAEESGRMLEAARARPGRLALLDHELRYLPARRELLRLTREGRLGSILRAEYTLYSPGRRNPDAPWSWWSDAGQGGGALGAIGSHAIDSLRLLLGEIESVRGHLDTFVRERPEPGSAPERPDAQPRADRQDPGAKRMRRVTSDDFAASWLRFASGALGTMTISMVEPERVHLMTLTGSAGAAQVSEQGPLRAATGSGGWSVVAASDDLPASDQLGIPDTDWARAFLRYARAIVGAIQRGEDAVPGASTFEDGHRNQQVLDAIRRSSADGGWVTV